MEHSANQSDCFVCGKRFPADAAVCPYCGAYFVDQVEIADALEDLLRLIRLRTPPFHVRFFVPIALSSAVVIGMAGAYVACHSPRTMTWAPLPTPIDVQPPPPVEPSHLMEN